MAMTTDVSTVKDLVRLAADNSGREAELYVRGDRPIAWLRSTSSSVRQQFRRYRSELAAFETAYGDPKVAVSAFLVGAGAWVAVIDVDQLAPELFHAV